MLGCLTCQTDFYFKNVTGLNTCVTQQCMNHFGYVSCLECYALKCLQCETDFYFKNVSNVELCVTTQFCSGFIDCQ